MQFTLALTKDASENKIVLTDESGNTKFYNDARTALVYSGAATGAAAALGIDGLKGYGTATVAISHNGNDYTADQLKAYDGTYYVVAVGSAYVRTAATVGAVYSNNANTAYDIVTITIASGVISYAWNNGTAQTTSPATFYYSFAPSATDAAVEDRGDEESLTVKLQDSSHNDITAAEAD